MPLCIGRRAVDDDPPVDVQAVLLHGTDDADDPQLAGRIVPQVLADRVAVRPEALRELLVDDDHLFRVVVRSPSAKNRPCTSAIFIVRK